MSHGLVAPLLVSVARHVQMRPVPVTTSNHREHGGQAGSSVGLLRGRPSLAHDRLKKAPHL